MKNSKLIFVSFALALALTFGGGFSNTAYASNDDPQGTSTTTKAPPAPQAPPPSSTSPDFWATLAAVLAGFFGV